MMMIAKQLTPADEAWGYKFGCDGLMGLEEASRWLAGVSESTLDRWATEADPKTGLTKIRKEKRGGKRVFCRRSVLEYASHGD